jgi:hypothetical protein
MNGKPIGTKPRIKFVHLPLAGQSSQCNHGINSVVLADLLLARRLAACFNTLGIEHVNALCNTLQHGNPVTMYGR